jgi:hypothetical protein
MIATDYPATQAELNKEWPIDAFTSGVTPPKPMTQSIKATVHHMPSDIDLSDPEVMSELEQQGITSAYRRINKAASKPTEYVTIFIKSKQASAKLLQDKLKLAICRFRVTIDEKVIQCFKCQKIGHTAAKCTHQVTCLRCGGRHNFVDLNG